MPLLQKGDSPDDKLGTEPLEVSVEVTWFQLILIILDVESLGTCLLLEYPSISQETRSR